MLEARGLLPTELIESLLEQVSFRARSVGDRITHKLEASTSEVISCAASLAHHGLLKSIRQLRIFDVDLSKVPSKHMVSLASCVTVSLHIWNVRGCDMISLLDSVKCRVLEIDEQNLSTEATQALVRAMETRVENAMLGHWREVTFDIEALTTQYNGQGKCWYITIGMSSLSSGIEKKLKKWQQLAANWSLESKTSWESRFMERSASDAVLVRKYLLGFENGKRFLIH